MSYTKEKEAVIMSTLGHNIAYLRKIKGITQENLAEMLQVSAQAVSKWENNISCPDILLLKPIANLFGVTVDQLLSAEEPKNLKNIQVANKILRIDFIDSQDNISLNIPLENLDELSKTEKAPFGSLFFKSSAADTAPRLTRALQNPLFSRASFEKPANIPDRGVLKLLICSSV